MSVSDEEIEVNKAEVNKSDDLVFLLFCAFIYEKRTSPGVSGVNETIGGLSCWLTKADKLKLDVEPCSPSTLDFDDPDTARLIDTLNAYSPEFPLKMLFSKESDTYVAKRISVLSPSTYTYKFSGPLELPFFHGGKIAVDGDVSFDTIVDLLASHRELSFTTEIDVTGSLVNCTSETLQLAFDNLRRTIYDKPDEELSGFSLRGSCQSETSLEDLLVRSWRISFTTTEARSCLSAVKIF